jgi:uncharacterized membrane protein
MYFFDVDRGRRHRAILRDKVAHVYKTGGHALDATGRDTSHRLWGVVASRRARLSPNGEALDDVLVARIRSKMGRLVSHPGAIEVTADKGHVTLQGPILAHEVDGFLKTVAATRGVLGLENRLSVHSEAEGVPALHGLGGTTGNGSLLGGRYWPPTTRLWVGSLGTALAYLGLRRGDILGLGAGFAGLAAAYRALTNSSIRRLLGIGTGRRGIDLHKTITLDAPVAEVYDFWLNFENFPRFMSHLKEVRDLGGGRSRWVALGPVGTPFQWEATITESIPNQTLAWKSVPGSVVANAGVVQFRASPEGGTQLDIRMSYNPPVGAVGHVVASMLGVDPKHAMDEDLARLKSLFVHGKTSAHGHQVSQEEIKRHEPGERRVA